MKTLLFFLIGIICFSQENENYISNQVILQFKNSSSKAIEDRFLENDQLSKIHEDIGVLKYTPIISKQENNPILIEFNGDKDLMEVIDMYQETQLFKYVEPNYTCAGSGVLNTVPNDTWYFRQWGLKNDGTFSATAVNGADIEMEEAWDIETGDPNMVVAVIDTGLRLNHPEFAGRIWINSDEIADGIDNDNNGFIDDLTAGWDFINNDNDPTDDHGHGTNVAGIAFASGDNSIGYAGVNWNSKVMICKALNASNSGSFAAIAGAIYYAVDNGAKVLNVSIGGSSNSITLSNAIDYCYNNGVILVACMMNFNNSVSYYPAAYEKTIAVGATDPDDTRSSPFFWSATSGSNFGNHIDLVAPGNFMYGLSYSSDTNYNSYWGGTSQATPLVAGVVSLLLAQKPSLTFEEIRTILRETAEDQVGDPSEDNFGFDIYHGYGRLNAKNALNHELLSVDEIKKVNDILIYPNPIQEDKKIVLSNLENGEYSISIYNPIGQQVLTDKIFSLNNKITLTLPDLNSGLYFLRIENKTKNVLLVKKLVIK